MKQKPTKKLALALLFSLTVSSQVFASGAKLPNIGDMIPTGTDTGSSSGGTTTGGTTGGTTSGTPADTSNNNTNGAYIDQIKTIAANSSCSSYSWSGRGKAPSGYIKGMALTYARSLCRLKAQDSLSQILSMADTNSSRDALTQYASNFVSLGVSTSTAGEGPLRALYTLGIGLAMRESSGSYCEGWDRSASSESASQAEAGLFQTSYDSMGASSELPKLYSEYQNSPDRCMLDVFKVGVSCSSSQLANYGTGAGATYQAFNKSCPAFAAEYAMTMLRVQRSHYGPINRKEAEVNSSCNSMLKNVQDLVDNNPNACNDLL